MLLSAYRVNLNLFSTSIMNISGKNFIGYSQSAENSKTFFSYIPASDTFLDEPFHPATASEVDRALDLAEAAFDLYAAVPAQRRAEFLIAITKEIMALGDVLIQRAHQETGLPLARLIGERGRTIGQLIQFADLLAEGSWVEASIDTAIPDRLPAPKPDIRKMMVPIGPVVVFGSSNFPFAYSVAGVDTGPALAAGNPVIVKAHPAHPGVSDLTAGAIIRAAQQTGMPEGVFSMVYDDGHEVGTQLVKHPHVKAVGFTGSFRGGMALHKLAQERDEPIPVYAEMGSVNPVIILPATLDHRVDELPKILAGSVTLGAGQFCTNPGLVFVIKSTQLTKFEENYRREIEAIAPATMLTAGICKNFYQLRAEALAEPGVEILAESAQASELKTQSQATVARVSGQDFIKHPTLQEEVFGPFSLLVVCEDAAELQLALSKLKGQLTAALFGEPAEVVQFPQIVRTLSRISGRFIMNAVPTGVEVCPSMHHGGPFPSSTDAKFSSVGRHSILRFVRPQSFQEWDDSLLPDELKDSNPLKIWRLFDNEWRK